jgi:hypothetical protein
MGSRPSDAHSIERVDVNGNYTPDNCIWATIDVQLRNTRRNRKLTFDGETLCCADWAIRLGISKQALHQRLRTMPVELALKPGRQPAGRKRLQSA